VLVLCGVCAAMPAHATDISPTRFITPNGMTVLVLEQHFLPIVEIHALIKAGSAQDPPEKAGLANFVASLLDEGTTTRSSRQLAEQIDFV
jgi:zinc protease